MKREMTNPDSQQVSRMPSRRRSNFFAPFLDESLDPSRLLDDFFGNDLSMVAGAGRAFPPAIDVEENANEYLICADLPGVKKEDISIECNGNQLTLTAERKVESREDRKHGRQERFYGTYMRSFTLPSGVDTDQIEAAYEDGVLKLHVPKGEQAKGKKIPIGEAKMANASAKPAAGAKH